MDHEALVVERLAGRYQFLERNRLLPMPSTDGITLIVELSRLDCASVCLSLLLRHSGEQVRIIAVAMTSVISVEALASQFAQEQAVMFLSYKTGEYMPNYALAFIETPFAVLLEDSVMVSPGWLVELLWIPFDDVTAKIVAPHSSSEIAEGKRSLPFNHYEDFMAHVNYSLGRHQGEWRQVDILTGSCLLFSKELLHRIGGFDATLEVRHLMIADWCLRARQTGAKLALSDAVYVHTIHSLDGYKRTIKADGWQSYCKKWGIVNGMDHEEHLVPPTESLQSPQAVIPLHRNTVMSPLVTAFVYSQEENKNGEKLQQHWKAALEQQTYKNIRWVWIRDSSVDGMSDLYMGERDVVITVRGEEAWLRAIKNASLLFESEITLYLSGSIPYEKSYIEQVVKALSQGSADLIVSLSSDKEEDSGCLYAGRDAGITLPLERVAHKGGTIPGDIVCKSTSSRQLQLQPNASLAIGYIGDFSTLRPTRTDSCKDEGGTS